MKGKILKILAASLFAVAMLVSAAPGVAAADVTNTACWVDWTSVNPSAGTASGVITLPDNSTVGVTFTVMNGTASGSFKGYLTSSAYNYWTPSTTFIGLQVPNPPTNAEMLQLVGGLGIEPPSQTYRVTFSPSVHDPIMAIVSLGSPTITTSYNFDHPFTILSQGTDYWSGPSNGLVQLPGNILQGNEGSGIIRFIGTYDTISWTIPTAENWHGFTFAIQTADADADVVVDEGQTATNSGPWNYPAGDSVGLTASAGDVAENAGTWSWSYPTTDGPAQSQVITITATDATAKAVSTATFQLTVNNVPPTITSISGPTTPVAASTDASFDATFTDPGTLDWHTAVWNWGDGSTSLGNVSETNGSGSVSGSHIYTVPGVYTVSLTVTDKDNGADTETYSQYVVVYDPAAGFVTGGGWITSPECAYAADPALTGKASFGFVAKYQKGATVPTGNTEFQFKAGDLNFNSTSYQWLVVAGAKAQFKGSGTINGAGDYGFILTAIDGQINGGGGIDKFRIKIFNKTDDTIVYDNLMDASDTADPTTTLGGGSIVIHN